jgi:hypothetical protein
LGGERSKANKTAASGKRKDRRENREIIRVKKE